MFSKFLGSFSITPLKQSLSKNEVNHNDRLDETKILVAPIFCNQFSNKIKITEAIARKFVRQKFEKEKWRDEDYGCNNFFQLIYLCTNKLADHFIWFSGYSKISFSNKIEYHWNDRSKVWEINIWKIKMRVDQIVRLSEPIIVVCAFFLKMLSKGNKLVRNTDWFSNFKHLENLWKCFQSF